MRYRDITRLSIKGAVNRICSVQKAFTLLELLVVISVVTILLAILLPALTATKSSAISLMCKSNIRQLLLANISYADENDYCYVPAASDMLNNSGLKRWHGARTALDKPFDPLHGPLSDYLSDGKVKECPANVNFAQDTQWNTSFERGCGGYGYNMTYIGSRLWTSNIESMGAWRNAYAQTTNITEIKNPDRTLMFADTAMANSKDFYIEYSFAEPPYPVENGQVKTTVMMSPSIHFRHMDSANIGWADGHAGSRLMGDSGDTNAYGVKSANMKLGWFEPIDNSLFDLE